MNNTFEDLKLRFHTNPKLDPESGKKIMKNRGPYNKLVTLYGEPPPQIRIKEKKVKVKKEKVKKEFIKMDDTNFDYMKTNKDNIINVIRDPENILIINNIANRVNRIIILTYQFLKLYFIHLYDNKLPFPIIDRLFIYHVFSVLTVNNNNGGCGQKQSEDMDNLISFYKDIFINTIDNQIIYSDKLCYILYYEAIDIVTNINNNIEGYFTRHLYKLINIVHNVKETRANITKNNSDKIIRKKLHNQFNDEINKVKDDLTSLDKLTSNEKYHDWIVEQRKILYPNKKSFRQDNIIYDIKCYPQSYLHSMFYISKSLETFNDEIATNNLINNTNVKEIRLFNVLPLRNNIIPKYIYLDTCGLITTFYTKGTKKMLQTFKEDNNQYEIWDKLFHLNKRVFKKGGKYKFHFMVQTDGVTCSILFHKIDPNGNQVNIIYKGCVKNFDPDHIENVTITDELINSKIVCADPGKSDLIYCGSKDDDGNLQTFRYTQGQRREETGTFSI